MGRLYRDEIITKSLKLGDREDNIEIGSATFDANGDIDGFDMRMFLPFGTPTVPAVAQLVVGGNDAEVTFKADVKGTASHAYSIEIVDPDGEKDQELSIDIKTEAIKIYPATSGAGAITTTANALVTAFNLLDVPITASVENGSGASAMAAAVAAPLAGGIDGIPAPAGGVMFNATHVFISVEESTVSVSNWKKAGLSA